ncbi:hypothetical protein GUJ93_ZPchr0012g22008 [Zizania palustris]|uniref:GTP--RNA guanylyltransferase n=1 Tax=Zizania palustris TaxID=103762 RepID=A0A8J6BXC3_ZIZPA|nr:hypothetical protein GUJ93_ZPchr0012g22008 [Zizania palustris]
MDLNASPSPEEDDQSYEGPIDVDFAQNEHVESSVEIMRREREERRRKLKREQPDDGPRLHRQQQQQIMNDHMDQSKIRRYGRIKEPPQGWLDCPGSGEPIDRIIPSKVPLDETFNESVPAGKRYSSKQVVNKQRKAGRDIGLVIDLTNTTRYYSPAEWTRQGTKHDKIACKGRDAVPDNESVNKFVFEVMAFLERQKQSRNPKYILVHCTHGHNRTGFMIVHYLMRTQLSSVTEAINMFAQRRPPGIYKNDYIQALYSFYHEIPEHIECPQTPEWKRPSDLDLNGEANQDDDDGNGELAPSPSHADDKVITNDDVLGDAIPCDQQDSLRSICFRLLDLVPNGRVNAQFPGSHPVSLNSENLQILRQRYYYATWKADGTRYMMLITRNGCFLIDRNFCFRRVQMRFPLRNPNEGFHHYTLIDGEMIVDTIPDLGLKRRYLAYDLMALHSHSKIKLPFSNRWKLLEDEIIHPRNHDKGQFDSGLKGSPSYKYDMELFSVRRKAFWPLSAVNKILKEFIPNLCHESDGLILQGWDDPYVTRTHEGLLKWKYPEMNSVDFLFEIGSENRQLIFLYERGRKKLMDGARVVFPDEVDPSSISGKIVECFWNKQEDCWSCMRIRSDKSTPNDINTYRKVMRSITDNITEDKLLEEINEIRSLPIRITKSCYPTTNIGHKPQASLSPFKAVTCVSLASHLFLPAPLYPLADLQCEPEFLTREAGDKGARRQRTASSSRPFARTAGDAAELLPPASVSVRAESKNKASGIMSGRDRLPRHFTEDRRGYPDIHVVEDRRGYSDIRAVEDRRGYPDIRVVEDRRGYPGVRVVEDRRGYPNIHGGPLVRVAPHPHPAILEEEIEMQEVEYRRLMVDHRALVDDQLTLHQELQAGKDEIRHLNMIIADINAKKEAYISELVDKRRKLEAELRANESLRDEIMQFRGEIDRLLVDRKELSAKAASIMHELTRKNSDKQQIPMLKDEIDGLRQELVNARSAWELEQKGNFELVEQRKAMEKSMVSMTQEIEQMRAELANFDGRPWGPGMFWEYFTSFIYLSYFFSTCEPFCHVMIVSGTHGRIGP